MTNLPIESYLATEDEMYALTTWAGKDGALLAALLDVDLVFGDH
jgi:hypothetical protein